MRRGLIYLLSIAIAVWIIHLVIRYGNGISAPVALPETWSYSVDPPSPNCPLFSSGHGNFQISQSGETLSIAFHEKDSFEMHGKLNREGFFRLAGKVPRGRFPNCSKGSLHWEGSAGRQGMKGELYVAGEDCQPCAARIMILGVPEL